MYKKAFSIAAGLSLAVTGIVTTLSGTVSISHTPERIRLGDTVTFTATVRDNLGRRQTAPQMVWVNDGHYKFLTDTLGKSIVTVRALALYPDTIGLVGATWLRADGKVVSAQVQVPVHCDSSFISDWARYNTRRDTLYWHNDVYVDSGESRQIWAFCARGTPTWIAIPSRINPDTNAVARALPIVDTVPTH